jgi:hypothetical protein
MGHGVIKRRPSANIPEIQVDGTLAASVKPLTARLNPGPSAAAGGGSAQVIQVSQNWKFFWG